MKKHFCGQAAVGLLVVIGLLGGGAAPSQALSRGFGSTGGFHHHPGVFSNHAFVRSPVVVNQRVVVNSRVVVNDRVFVGSRVFVGHRPFCCFGPRVFVSVGVGVPFWSPFPVYSPPVVMASSPPAYVAQNTQSQYWYYCQSAQGYYPYVKECPGGWLQVVPQSSPPPPVSG